LPAVPTANVSFPDGISFLGTSVGVEGLCGSDFGDGATVGGFSEATRRCCPLQEASIITANIKNIQ
jgi:hypothetical protein